MEATWLDICCRISCWTVYLFHIAMKRINKKMVIRKKEEFNSGWDYLAHLNSLIDDVHLFLMELVKRKTEFTNKKTKGGKNEKISKS